MTVSEWRSEDRGEGHELADGFAEHLVERLISTIEAVPDGYPPTEWWQSIKRQAAGIRDEAKKGARRG